MALSRHAAHAASGYVCTPLERVFWGRAQRQLRPFATAHHRGAEAVRFAQYPDDARRTFETWVHEKLPVLHTPRITGIKAVYLPFWSFSARVVVRDRSGRVVLTEPAPPGPGMQVYGGHTFPRPLVEVAKTEPSWAKPFEPSMLDLGAGWVVDVQPFETYEATAWQLARASVLSSLSTRHPSLVGKSEGGGVEFTAVVSRRLLLPAYEVKYAWWGEELRCIINGSTGAAYGVQADMGGATLRRILDGIKRATAGGGGSGGGGGVTLDPSRLRLLFEVLRRLGFAPSALGPLGALLTGVLRPAVKLLFWPPFLVGSLLAFAGFALRQGVMPIRKQRVTFAEWEEVRAAERRMQSGMSDEWVFRPAEGGGRSSSSSTRQQGGSQRQQPGRSEKAAPGRRPPPINEEDFYGVLGLAKGASTPEVQAAFRREL